MNILFDGFMSHHVFSSVRQCLVLTYLSNLNIWPYSGCLQCKQIRQACEKKEKTQKLVGLLLSQIWEKSR